MHAPPEVSPPREGHSFLFRMLSALFKKGSNERLDEHIRDTFYQLIPLLAMC